MEEFKRRLENAIGFRKVGLQSVPALRDKTYSSTDLIEILDSILEDVNQILEAVKENV